MQRVAQVALVKQWNIFLRKNQDKIRDFTEQDLCPDSEITVDACNLPYELKFKILEILANHYLYTFNYDLLLDLLKVNKNFMRMKYTQLYEKSNLASYILYGRLSATFRMLEEIHDGYIQTGIYTGSLRPNIVVESPYHDATEPWEYRFERISVMYNENRNRLQYQIDNGTYTYGSMVDLEYNSLYEIRNAHYPLLDILWTCSSCVFSNQTLQSLLSPNFTKFGNFLRQQYGDLARVRYVIPELDDNPFLLTNNTFITL